MVVNIFLFSFLETGKSLHRHFLVKSIEMIDTTLLIHARIDETSLRGFFNRLFTKFIPSQYNGKLKKYFRAKTAVYVP